MKKKRKTPAFLLLLHINIESVYLFYSYRITCGFVTKLETRCQAGLITTFFFFFFSSKKVLVSERNFSTHRPAQLYRKSYFKLWKHYKIDRITLSFLVHGRIHSHITFSFLLLFFRNIHLSI